MRESTKFMLLVVLGLLMGVVLVVNVSCGGNSPTNVVDEFAGSGSGVTQSVAPTPAPSPSLVPVGTAPYVEFNKDPKDGSGTMFNPTNHPVTFTIEYFNATDFHKQVLLLAAKHIVDPKSSKALPPAKDVLKLTCGLTWDIQIDASTTSHLGHLIFQIQTDKCQECTWKELEPEIKYSEWGECKAVPTSTESACTHSRIKTTTIREQNTCTDEIRIKSTKEETQSEPCQCACVEEWKELDPEITYGEWSVCGPNKDMTCEAECSQSRSKRTIIREESTCTKATRIKSDTTTTETRSCPCPPPPPPPECKATIPSEPYCENSNPENECSYYGLDFLGKVEDGFLGPKWFGNPPSGTALVIVKAGSCQSTGNKMHALYYPPYTPNQMFYSATGKEISHITFCGCVED